MDGELELLLEDEPDWLDVEVEDDDELKDWLDAERLEADWLDRDDDGELTD